MTASLPPVTSRQRRADLAGSLITAGGLAACLGAMVLRKAYEDAEEHIASALGAGRETGTGQPGAPAADAAEAGTEPPGP
jgi:hypothetical protein